MDFCRLKSEILALCENLEQVNLAYKLEKNSKDFFESERAVIRKLSEQVTTSVNILKKLEKKSKISMLDPPMKQKKIAEKILVNKQLEEQPLTIHTEENDKIIKFDNEQDKTSELHKKSYRINDLGEVCKKCYICKKKFKKLHHFYDQMCVRCGDFNYLKRQQKCDLHGKTAVVTGCRIKIGYETCLYLLRNNCSQVIGTTRFPKDAYVRFSHEPDFDLFKTRLKIYPLDLRDLNSVSKFVSYLNSTLDKLDILINNAAQTIRRSIKFYEHLFEIESQGEEFFDQSIKSILVNNQSLEKSKYQELNSVGLDTRENQLALSVKQSQIALLKEDFEANVKVLPKDVLDKDGQQVDLSFKSSWNKRIEEVDFFEFAETQVINSWAPFMLCSKLKDLMCRIEKEPKFIVNVSSMEGKFNRYKNTTHPHTNMSKASLNMLTRTCGPDLARHNIFMTSVDTGWVSEMNPFYLYNCKRTVPLDEFDGAIRVLDPIIQGYNKNVFLHSIFLKDFRQTKW